MLVGFSSDFANVMMSVVSPITATLMSVGFSSDVEEDELANVSAVGGWPSLISIVPLQVDDNLSVSSLFSKYVTGVVMSIVSYQSCESNEECHALS